MTGEQWISPGRGLGGDHALYQVLSLIIATFLGTMGLPHVLVRFYTNPDGVAAKRTTMWVMILIGIFYVFPPVFGVMGRNLMPALYDGSGVNGTDGSICSCPDPSIAGVGALAPATMPCKATADARLSPVSSTAIRRRRSDTPSAVWTRRPG